MNVEQRLKELEPKQGFRGLLSNIGDFNEATIMEGPIGRYFGPLLPITLAAIFWLPFQYAIFENPREQEKIRLNLQNQVSIIADINKDGITSQSEWARVYNSLGIQYDFLNKRDLTSTELKDYLGKH